MPETQKRKFMETKNTGSFFILKSIVACIVEVISGPLFYGREHDDDRPAHWYAFDFTTAFKYGTSVLRVHTDSIAVLKMGVPAIKLLLAIAKQHEKGPDDIGIQYVFSKKEMRQALCDESASGISFLFNPETKELCRRSVQTDQKFIDFINEHLSDISDALGQPVEGFVSRLEGHHPEVYLTTPVGTLGTTDDVYKTPPRKAHRVTYSETEKPNETDEADEADDSLGPTKLNFNECVAAVE